jgi:hypothetical protein
MNKNWYAVITADVLYDKTLTSRQKILVAVISNLSNEKGYCFASNNYLAEICNTSIRSIQRDLNVLEGLYIGKVMHLKSNGEVDYRALTPMSSVSPPHDKFVTTPHDKDVIYNNKLYNNKNNICGSPPNFLEFKEYALSKKNDICLEKLKLKYDSWVENDWVTANDKPIKNWKTTLLNTLPYLKKEKSSAKKEKSLAQKMREQYGL